MKHINFTTLAIAGLSLFQITPAMAVEQCFSEAGIYGNLTVTQSGTGCGSLIDVPPTYLYLGEEIADESCEFTLSPAVVGSTVTTEFFFVNATASTAAEEVTVAMEGSQVDFQVGDLVSGSLIPSNGTPLAPTIGGITQNPADVTLAGSGGMIRFAAAPAAVTTVELRYNYIAGTPGGVLAQVCADDAGLPPPPPPAPVPTISAYCLGLTVLGLILVAVRRLRVQGRQK